jgi:protein-disulfide isomerase
MSSEVKALLGVGLATLVIIGGGVFFFGQPAIPEVVGGEVLVRPDSPKIAGNSEVTLVEFADFQCPACAAAHPGLKQLMINYEGRLNRVFRHFPLSQHANAMIAAQAAEAAGEQGQFWPMHDRLFERQKDWENLSRDEVRGRFESYAQELGLHIDQFRAGLDNRQLEDKIRRDIADGRSAGVANTPTFFINGKKMANGTVVVQELEALLGKP